MKNGKRSNGKYDKHNYFKITCIKECDTEQMLYVMADGEKCGAIKIHPNTSKYQKKINIVFINVSTNINGEEKTGEAKKGGVDFFKQNLNQALIIPNLTEEKIDLDCTGNFIINEFKKKFCTLITLKDGKKEYQFTKSTGLRNYLEKKLKEQFKDKYKGYYTVFFIGENSSWNGFSYFNSTFGVYFAGHNKGTIAHELFHALNLPHTFDALSASARYTYKARVTNNIMDYSHQCSINRFCLYHWQWKIINTQIK